MKLEHKILSFSTYAEVHAQLLISICFEELDTTVTAQSVPSKSYHHISPGTSTKSLQAPTERHIIRTIVIR